jgi:hypothetical protein
MRNTPKLKKNEIMEKMLRNNYAPMDVSSTQFVPVEGANLSMKFISENLDNIDWESLFSGRNFKKDFLSDLTEKAKASFSEEPIFMAMISIFCSAIVQNQSVDEQYYLDNSTHIHFPLINTAKNPWALPENQSERLKLFLALER